MSFRILLTCRSLSHRGGSEMHVRDLALALVRRGHQVTVWSPEPGDLAAEIESAGARVVAGPPPSGPPPDVLHAHQFRELVLAMLRHPSVPVVFTCHSALDEESTPWPLPAVRRAIAVGAATVERLAGAGFSESAIVTIANTVDLARFAPRPPLPATPRRALMFSNYIRESLAEPVRTACRAAGIELEIAGSESGRAEVRPEDLLGSYDLVFAKGRCALEAMAVGCAVIVADAGGLGGMVRAEDVPALRAENIGFRCLTRPLDAELIAGELARYSPAEAVRVRDLIRRDADLQPAVDATLAVYRDAIGEGLPATRAAWRDTLPQALAPHLADLFDRQRKEARAVAAELETAARRTADELETALAAAALEKGQRAAVELEAERRAAAERAQERATSAEADAQALRLDLEAARAQAERLADELGRVYGTRTWRLRERLLRSALVRDLRQAWRGRGTAGTDQS